MLTALSCQNAPAPVRSTPRPVPPPLRVDEGLKLKRNGMGLRWQAEAPPTLLVSTSRQARAGSDPLRSIPLSSRTGEWTDPDAQDGVSCYYRLKVGDRVSDEIEIAWPDRPLPRLSRPSFLVDKPNYSLEVQDNGRRVKRYPIAMGRNPENRKLCYDNASTPEGRYRIIGVQPEATYYRAYDIDYPNAHDQERYAFYRRNGLLEGDPGIGGEIQIHGKGIGSNWTFGCMALRNEDMDELFSHPEIGVGTPVTIVGAQLTCADLETIDAADREAVAEALHREGCDSLGQFQMKRKLPVSCLPDLRTMKALGLK